MTEISRKAVFLKFLKQKDRGNFKFKNLDFIFSLSCSKQMGFFHAQNEEVVIRMASRIQGITVEIGGDTTKLSKALESVNKSIKVIRIRNWHRRRTLTGSKAKKQTNVLISQMK